MTDEFIILTGLDQPLPTDNDWVLAQVDDIVDEALKRRNPEIALKACETLVKASKLSGVGLAKLLYMLQVHWHDFGMEATFEDIVYPRFGLHRHTIERYIRVWKMKEAHVIPPEIEKHIMQKNIKTLIPIANALEQGYTLSRQDWKSLAIAPDHNSVSRYIREEVKGAEPRKSSLQIYLDDMGDLWVYKDQDRHRVGELDIDSDVAAVQQAIKRITDSAGILT